MHPGTSMGGAGLRVRDRWPTPPDETPRVPPTEVPNVPERVPAPAREIPVQPNEIPGPAPSEVPEPYEQMHREGGSYHASRDSDSAPGA